MKNEFKVGNFVTYHQMYSENGKTIFKPRKGYIERVYSDTECAVVCKVTTKNKNYKSMLKINKEDNSFKHTGLSYTSSIDFGDPQQVPLSKIEYIGFADELLQDKIKSHNS